MDTFSRFAFFTVARDASFSALAAGILMVAYSFDLSLAFVIGASVAMFFTAVMLIRAFLLTEDRIIATEPWLVMQPDERPVGDAGRAYAREQLENMLLTGAKSASGVASILFGLGLLTSWA